MNQLSFLPPPSQELTAKRLRYLLRYDKKTGRMYWRQSRQKVQRHAEAGSKNWTGYWRIKVDGVLYLRSRLAYLYVTGSWPPDEIDHINRNRCDDRWCNLRPVTHRQNCQNKTKASGLSPGVFWHKRDKRFYAQISIAGRKKYLGCFDAAAEAAQAVRAAVESLGEEML